MNTGVMGHRLFWDNPLHTAVALTLATVALALSIGPIIWLMVYLGAAVVFGPVLEHVLPNVRGELAPPERNLILPASTNVGFSPPIWVGFAIIWCCLVVCAYLYPDEVVVMISRQHDAWLAHFSDPTNNGLIPMIAKARLAFERDGGAIQHFIVLALVASCLLATYFVYFFCIFFGGEIRENIRNLYFNTSVSKENIKNYIKLVKFLFGIASIFFLFSYGIVRGYYEDYEFSVGFSLFYILYFGSFLFFFWLFPFVFVFIENYIRVLFFRRN